MREVEECFKTAIKDEEKGKKHKGLLIISPNDQKAKEYLNKAKINLELCDLYRERRIDYKIPEEWFYTFYYCGLAILTKFGIESRSQRCTALFLRYVKNKDLIDYDNEFIDRITVHRDKEKESDVDEREKARYGPSIKNEEVTNKYEFMTNLCRKAIFQCEEIIFSNREFKIPNEIIKLIKDKNALPQHI